MPVTDTITGHPTSFVGEVSDVYGFNSGRGCGLRLHGELFAVLQAHLPGMNSGIQQRCISIHKHLMLDRLSETRMAEISNRQKLSSLYQQHKHDRVIMAAAVTAWADAQQALAELTEAIRHELAKLDTHAWSLGLDRCGMPDVPSSASQSRRECVSSNSGANSGILNDEPPVQSIKIVARPRSLSRGYSDDGEGNDARTTGWGRMLSGATACTATHKLGRCTKVVHSVYQPANPHRLDVYSVEIAPVSGPVSGY